jgi:hypothetical protein
VAQSNVSRWAFGGSSYHLPAPATGPASSSVKEGTATTATAANVQDPAAFEQLVARVTKVEQQLQEQLRPFGVPPPQ